jgi:8-oxo-dGTP diphosphatase
MKAHDDSPVFRFCAVCGGGLEARVLKAGERARLVCEACGFVFYIDPKVAVGTIIGTANGAVVLVRRGIDPGYGKWVFPGGYVDRGEEVRGAAIREAREETGLDIRLEGLINIYSYPEQTPVLLVYAATIVGGTMAAADECLEVGAFQQSEIPWSKLAFRSTHESLRDYFAGVLHRPALSTPGAALSGQPPGRVTSP